MYPYLQILGLNIPGYGLMIITGVITANLIAIYLLRKYRLDGNDFLILEAYIFLGAFIGAKILYILVAFSAIEWNRIIEPDYFNLIMQGGFVFYGGLIGGLLFMLLASRIHHIDYRAYISHFIALIPWIHGFGRIGCFLAGCCYGMPYHGFGAVIFPEGSFAPPGISMFPVQLLEAAALFVLTVVIFMIDRASSSMKTVYTYFIGYGIIRFGLEFVRYDAERGSFLMLSTSQWISIAFILAAAFLCLRRRIFSQG